MVQVQGGRWKNSSTFHLSLSTTESELLIEKKYLLATEWLRPAVAELTGQGRQLVGRPPSIPIPKNLRARFLFARQIPAKSL